MFKLKKFFVCVFFLSCAAIAKADNIELHVMGGQSNMQGWRSDAKDYPADTNNVDQSIPFFFEAVDYASTGRTWESLRPQEGHFLNGHFGPEVTFARSLKHFGFTPSIFKFSFGSSSLVEIWKAPGKNGLYDRMIRELNLSIRLLEQAGHTVEIKSFTWIQGETDAKNDPFANQYYWNLQKLLHDFRHNVAHNPTLPIILGVDEQHPLVKLRPQVITAQQKLSHEDPNIVYTSMYGLEKSDVTHLTAKGVIEHGKRLFTAYLNLTVPLGI